MKRVLMKQSHKEGNLTYHLGFEFVLEDGLADKLCADGKAAPVLGLDTAITGGEPEAEVEAEVKPKQKKRARKRSRQRS